MKIGIEAEGKNKGLKTLFIADEAYALSIFNDVAQIYFGAGKSEVTTAISSIRNLPTEIREGKLITLEVSINEVNDLPLDIIRNTHIVVRFDNLLAGLEGLKDTDEIKIETQDNCFIATKNCFIKNELNYIYDKEIK